MTLPDPDRLPVPKAGQVWQGRKQKYRVRVISVSPAGDITGDLSITGETVHAGQFIWKGEVDGGWGFNTYGGPVYREYDLTQLLYDPS